MKKQRRTTPDRPETATDGDMRVVEFRLRDSDFKMLEALARSRQTTISRLITEALPLVIEKFRVLRALDIQPDERAGWRRRDA